MIDVNDVVVRLVYELYSNELNEFLELKEVRYFDNLRVMCYIPRTQAWSTS